MDLELTFWIARKASFLLGFYHKISIIFFVLLIHILNFFLLKTLFIKHVISILLPLLDLIDLTIHYHNIDHSTLISISSRTFTIFSRLLNQFVLIGVPAEVIRILFAIKWFVFIGFSLLWVFGLDMEYCFRYRAIEFSFIELLLILVENINWVRLISFW